MNKPPTIREATERAAKYGECFSFDEGRLCVGPIGSYHRHVAHTAVKEQDGKMVAVIETKKLIAKA